MGENMKKEELDVVAKINENHSFGEELMKNPEMPPLRTMTPDQARELGMRVVRQNSHLFDDIFTRRK